MKEIKLKSNWFKKIFKKYGWMRKVSCRIMDGWMGMYVFEYVC